MLKGSLIEDLANIFFGFCLTFLVYDMEHMLKTIPDHYEIYFFCISKNNTNTSFTKF